MVVVERHALVTWRENKKKESLPPTQNYSTKFIHEVEPLFNMRATVTIHNCCPTPLFHYIKY